MKRVASVIGWLWVASLVPCVAGTVEIDVLTSFPISMPGGDLAGDLTYSPTSNTLLVVPAKWNTDHAIPYYREFSADGEVLRTVELPTCLMDPSYPCLYDIRLMEIEMDPSTPTLLVAQPGPVGGGTSASGDVPGEPVNWPSVIVYAASPTNRITYLFGWSFPSPGSGFSGVAVNPMKHTFRLLFYEEFFEVDYAGNVLKRASCDLTKIHGMTYDPEDNRYYGIPGLDVYSDKMTLIQRVSLPSELYRVSGITHGAGDIFWFSSADRIFKVRIAYTPPPDEWMTY